MNTDMISKAESWLPNLRSLPAIICPSERSLQLFAAEPLAVENSSYNHIVRGCEHCSSRLRSMLLGAS